MINPENIVKKSLSCDWTVRVYYANNTSDTVVVCAFDKQEAIAKARVKASSMLKTLTQKKNVIVRVEVLTGG